MPAKRDASTELAEKMLRVLGMQRDLGTHAYPTKLQRLAELTDAVADTQTVQKAVKKKAFTDRAIVVQAKDPDCPVALLEDADQLAQSPALLTYLLESLCTAAKPSVDVSALKKRAPARVREAFGKSLDQRIADNALPPGMAVLTVRKKLHLHLQRYPLPRKPEVVLAEELVKVLHSQRQLGAGAYPIPLARLIEMTRPAAAGALVEKAMAHATFKKAVVLAIKSDPQTPLALAGDLELLADSPLLLVMALRKARTETDQVRSPKDLKKQVVPPLREAFEMSINRRALDGQLPSEVGRLLQKKKPLLFLIGDIVSGHAARGERAQSAPARPEGFAQAFDEAFQRLDKQSRSHNFVSLLELRRELPFDQQKFDAGLRELRRAGRYTLSATEGRQGISPDEQRAGMIEDGALLLYVSRKLS